MSAALRTRPSLYSTAVGKKYAMAISGMVLMGYVLVHMVGNLKFYFGAESLDKYSEWLREVGEPALPRETLLWGVRGRAARRRRRPHPRRLRADADQPARAAGAYRSKRDYVAADFASRTMRWTGIIVLLFVVFHLLDLTWGPANPDFVARRPVPQHRRELRARAGGARLHRREPGARRAPLPRRVEPVPEHGLGAPVAARSSRSRSRA